MKKMCKSCNGTGKIVGGGYIPEPCLECRGHGKVTVVFEDEKGEVKDSSDKGRDVSDATNIKVDKRSKVYQDAIKDLVEKTGLDKEAAKKVFDEEMDKMDE